MKKYWDTRIKLLEQSHKAIYGEAHFNQWLEENPPDPSQDLWALLDMVPEDMRLYCLYHIIEKLREQRHAL